MLALSPAALFTHFVRYWAGYTAHERTGDG